MFNGNELMRMGFTRFNIPYYYTDEEIEYVVSAVEFICQNGWMLLPSYKFDIDRGVWVNRDEKEQQQRTWLGQIDYSQGYFSQKAIAGREQAPCSKTTEKVDFAHYLDLAKKHLLDTIRGYKTNLGKTGVDQTCLVPDDFKHLIWWLFPSQVLSDLQQIKQLDSYESLSSLFKDSQKVEFSTPFKPKDYNRAKHHCTLAKEYINNSGSSESTNTDQGKSQEKEEVT